MMLLWYRLRKSKNEENIGSDQFLKTENCLVNRLRKSKNEENIGSDQFLKTENCLVNSVNSIKC